MRTTNEFVIEWITGDDRATVTVPEGTALSTRLVKLSEEYPIVKDILALIWRRNWRWEKGEWHIVTASNG